MLIIVSVLNNFAASQYISMGFLTTPAIGDNNHLANSGILSMCSIPALARCRRRCSWRMRSGSTVREIKVACEIPYLLKGEYTERVGD